MVREISVNLGNMLCSLSEIIDIANPYISHHQQRTALIAMRLAESLSAPQDVLEKIFASALLHDIGAITIEEKTLLHENRETNLHIHCARGAALVEGLEWFDRYAPVINNHHTNRTDFDESVSDDNLLASQIIHLSDFIERCIDRNQYILFQREKIADAVLEQGEDVFSRMLINQFLGLSKKEEFWLEIQSSRVYSILLKRSPFQDRVISADEINQLAALFKRIIDFKSSFTATHTTGVEASTEKMAQLFGFSDRETRLLKIAGSFHDIGKLVIPSSILNKPAPLSREETELMRSHTYYTYVTLNSIPGLYSIAEWAAFHHEKCDGTGYPFHYKSHELSTGSKIVTVADIFTALKEDRPYRKGMDKNEIFSVFSELIDAGHLDKNIVSLVFDNFEELHEYVKVRQNDATSLYNSIFLEK